MRDYWNNARLEWSSIMYRAILIAFYITVFTGSSSAEWTQIESAPSETISDILDYDGVLFLAYWGEGVYRSGDSTVTWGPVNDGLDNSDALVVFQLLEFQGNLYAATIDGIYRSTDSGANWIKKSDGIEYEPGIEVLYTQSIFEYNGSLFTGAINGIYRSIDDGENWMITNISGVHSGAKYFANHNGTLFAARETNNQPYAYRSMDDGASWEPYNVIPLPTIFFYSDPPNLWSGTISGVWLSTNDGASWTQRSEGLASEPYVPCVIRVNGTLLTSLLAGLGSQVVFRSTDEGIFWEEFGEGFESLTGVEDLMVFGDRILAGSRYGLWQRDTSEIATGIAFNDNISPESHEIVRNYPNPFNSSTTIVYSISQPSNVKIEIYDILGRISEVVENRAASAGQHKVIWNADGKPSGIYYYRLASDGYSETGRMILLK